MLTNKTFQVLSSQWKEVMSKAHYIHYKRGEEKCVWVCFGEENVAKGLKFLKAQPEVVEIEVRDTIDQFTPAIIMYGEADNPWIPDQSHVVIADELDFSSVSDLHEEMRNHPTKWAEAWLAQPYEPEIPDEQ